LSPRARAKAALTLAHATVLPRADAAPMPDTDVRIEGHRIVLLGRGLPRDGKVLDCTGLLVLPGFIHGHVHVCQSLFRGMAPGLELREWLRERIWPLEAAHDAESLRASADLAFLELIRSGATAALDMGTVHHQDVIFESAAAAGFRLTSGKSMIDAGQGLPRALREETEASLRESDRLATRWHGTENGRLRYAYAPRFVLTSTEALLRGVAERAGKDGLRVHTHASETQGECAALRERTGRDTLVHFHALGLSGPDVTLAHCVWLTAEERRLLRERRTVVCHCPSSNLKLGSGIAHVTELLGDGVPLALGADGAACNDNLDLFQEMRLCSLLQAVRSGPAALPSRRVLELAQRGGAAALGLSDALGELAPGRLADLVALDLGGPHIQPAEDVVEAVVHAVRSSDVRHVVIDGRLVMRDRKVLTLDEEEVLARARVEAARLRATLA
jgi:5-methylthioadenosine/S-adenosylhomocysteine deaminase